MWYRTERRWFLVRLAARPGGAAFVCTGALLLACGGRADLEDPGFTGAGVGASGPGSGASGPGSGNGPSGAGATATSGDPGSGSGASGTGAAGVGGAGASGSGSGGSSVVCEGGPSTPCTECIAETCSEVWCGCLEEPSCLGLFGCFEQCAGDPMCEQGCLQQFEPGIADVLLVSDCAGGACSAICGWGNDVPPCAECIYDKCEDETNACFVEPECLALLQCLMDCDPLQLSCQDQCYDDHGGGVETLEVLLQCRAANCESRCP